MSPLPEFPYDGKCEVCKRARRISKTGICEACLKKMLSLREGEDRWKREKRLQDLASAERLIFSNVGDQAVKETDQTTPERQISLPKLLRERDARKVQNAKARAALAELVRQTRLTSKGADLLVQAVVETYGKTKEGDLVRALVSPWQAIAQELKRNWDQAFKIPPRVWEELIAAAFAQDGYDEVILTPRSGDFGRDVVAIKKGVGCVRIIGSVKAFAPHRLVRQDDVRALLGVLHGDQQASKGIITTTSDFAPGIATDPYLSPFMPTRLELMNGTKLREWLTALSLAK